MTDDPRYPVGRFAAPAAWDPALLPVWRSDIAQTPVRLRAAVHGLTDAQLDTPYRDGGWTVRQVIHHMFDSHANAYCRLKLAITEDNPTIKPYDEALWAELPDARRLPVASSLALLDGLHLRWVAAVDAMTPADLQRTYFHPEQNTSTPLWRMMALYAWHGRHHAAHITELRTRQHW
jgi:uncharacterized damage-inducible protein DinB